MESEMDISVRARISTPTRGPAIETLIPTTTLLHLLQTWGGSREELAYCGSICSYRWQPELQGSLVVLAFSLPLTPIPSSQTILHKAAKRSKNLI